jgi:DNA-binding MarR family transcriptional regulator
MSFEPESFRARREQVLLRLLLRVTRAMTVETVERIRARGHREMQPSFPRFLGNLDTEGTRIGALARRMGTSRQAVSQLLKEVEAAGLVERRADPDDRRGVIILFTPHGRQVLADAVEVMTGIEADYASIIGEQGLVRLKRILKQILDQVDRPGAFGMD